MTDASVLYVLQDRIATITLYRPAVMNALSSVDFRQGAAAFLGKRKPRFRQ